MALGGKEGYEVLAAVGLPLPLVETCGDDARIDSRAWERGQGLPGEGGELGKGPRQGWGGGRGLGAPRPLQNKPSSPKTFPQWVQKKCSGCQVWSMAVRTFCGER